MKASSIIFIRCVGTFAALCLCLLTAMAQPSSSAGIVRAADTFLSTLDVKQRHQVLSRNGTCARASN